MQGSDTQLIQVFLAAGILMAVLVLIIILFVVVYQRRLVRQQIRVQQLELDYQKEVLHATVDTQEKERERIARDLHDEIGAMLSAVRMNLNLHDRQLKQTNTAVDLAEAKEMLSSAIGSVRSISHDLLPPSLSTLGLAPALESFMEKVRDLSGLKIEFQASGEVRRFPPKTELATYRVVQELANNSLRHGQAQSLRLHIDFQSNPPQIVYQDDGIGFERNEVIKGPGGLGLKNMQSRMELVGGSFSIESGKGKGVRALLRIPEAKAIENQ